MAQKQNYPDIARTATRLARQVEIALSKNDLSLAQYRVLYQLSEGTVASSRLATANGVSPPSITNVVEGLVQRGLVQREHSVDDRRRVSLSMTTAGEELLARAETGVEERLTGLASEVEDPQFAKNALAGLAMWAEAMQAHRVAKRETKVKVASR